MADKKDFTLIVRHGFGCNFAMVVMTFYKTYTPAMAQSKEIKYRIAVGNGDDDNVLEIDVVMLSQTGFVGRSDYGNATGDEIDMDFYGAIATKQDLSQESVGYKYIDV